MYDAAPQTSRKGNWAVLMLTIEGSRAQPLLFRTGSLIVLAGLSFRICKVTT